MSKKSELQERTEAARLGKKVSRTVIYTLLTVWGLIVLFPFYWMILSSVKSYGAYNAEYIPRLFTLSPTFENYLSAFTAVPLAKYLLNTLIFTVITTLVMLFVNRAYFKKRQHLFTK